MILKIIRTIGRVSENMIRTGIEVVDSKTGEPVEGISSVEIRESSSGGRCVWIQLANYDEDVRTEAQRDPAA